MYFHSLGKAYKLYNTYASVSGFGVRRGSVKKMGQSMLKDIYVL